jgi:hypothetical protein
MNSVNCSSARYFEECSFEFGCVQQLKDVSALAMKKNLSFIGMMSLAE